MYFKGDIVEGYSKFYEKRITLYVISVSYIGNDEFKLQGYKLNSKLKRDKRVQWKNAISCNFHSCRLIKRNINESEIN